MAFVNFATREITAKVVYYGPGLGGKTTSLQYIHNSLPSDNRGKMISLATEEDRTIYFDFLPLNLGKIQDFAVRVQLYTVPGQVRYNATRKLVLRGADGLVFVADSQKHKKLSNLESFSNMEENLREHGKDLRDLPHVLQFNKIDLPNRMAAEDLSILLNKYNVPNFETCATAGTGVLESLKSITKLVFNDLGKKALLQKRARPTSGPQVQQYSAEKPVTEKVTSAVSTSSSFSRYLDPPIVTPNVVEAPAEESFAARREPYPELEMVEPRDEHQTSPASLADSGEFHEEIESVEFEEVVSEEQPFVEPETPLAEESRPERFTFERLFDGNSEFKPLIERLEQQILDQETAGATVTARAAYSLLTRSLFPKELMLDGHDSSIILALNIKFKRFERFKRLIGSENLELPDLLFLHHFLCDLYLSIKEL